METSFVNPMIDYDDDAQTFDNPMMSEPDALATFEEVFPQIKADLQTIMKTGDLKGKIRTNTQSVFDYFFTANPKSTFLGRFLNRNPRMSKCVTFLRKLFLLSDEEIQINAIKLREVIPPDNSTLVKLRESVTKLQSKNVFFFPKLQDAS